MPSTNLQSPNIRIWFGADQASGISGGNHHRIIDRLKTEIPPTLKHLDYIANIADANFTVFDFSKNDLEPDGVTCVFHWITINMCISACLLP